MAATCCAISFCSLSCLLFLSSPSHSYVWATRILPSDSDKVSVELYYESLCPYSASFIINYLATVFQKDELISIIDLRLFPWGNAKINSNSTFDCQHGPSECLLNTIEACAIAAWSDVNKHFPFINCIETLVYKRKFLEWETCFDMLGLDAKPIVECYSSGHGKELELQYAAETSVLEPPHKYVPWVVVDGQPLYEDYENFLSYVCKAYKGSALPSACKELSIIRFPKGNSENFDPSAMLKSIQEQHYGQESTQL